jgi:lysophospholipase L1-like esterase
LAAKEHAAMSTRFSVSLFGIGFLLLAASAPARAQVKVSCIGASTTRGSGASANQSYPDQLGRLLGNGYRVGNFGLSSATMLRKGNPSYWRSSEFQQAQSFAPNVVVVWLGGADSKAQNWEANKGEFLGDYKAMVAHFQQLPTRPRVIAMLSVALRDESGVRKAVVEAQVQPLQRQAAAESGIPLVDTAALVAGHPEYFADGVHLTNAGYGAVARAVQALILAPSADAGAGAGDGGSSSDAAPADSAGTPEPDAGAGGAGGAGGAPAGNGGAGGAGGASAAGGAGAATGGAGGSGGSGAATGGVSGGGGSRGGAGGAGGGAGSGGGAAPASSGSGGCALAGRGTAGWSVLVPALALATLLARRRRPRARPR